MRALVDDVAGDLRAAIKMVQKADCSLLIVDSHNRPVATLKPAPKPIRQWKGRPVYRVEDADDLGIPRE